MSSDTDSANGNIEPLAPGTREQSISGELDWLVSLLRERFPQTKQISFEFVHDLRLHLDVASLSDAHVIEAVLPSMCEGIFSETFVGQSPHHPFFQRVTAKVSR